MPPRSWEEPLRDWEVVADDEAAPIDWEDCSDEESALYSSGADAGHIFVDELQHLLNTGKISAKTMCVLCWWASRAGAEGPMGK